jgi:hypothetical protein
LRLPHPERKGPNIYTLQEQDGPVPFSSPPSTRRAAVELIEPASKHTVANSSSIVAACLLVAYQRLICLMTPYRDCLDIA